MNWLMLYNKRIETPFVPSFSSPSDTSNFEKFVDEDTSLPCDDVDQSYFTNF